MVIPMVVALAKHPVVDDYDLSGLRWILSGAAPLSAELAIECGERIGCEVVQGYGMTELSPTSHATPPNPSATDVSRPRLTARRPVRDRICGSPRIARAIKIHPKVLVTHITTPNTRRCFLADIIASS